LQKLRIAIALLGHAANSVFSRGSDEPAMASRIGYRIERLFMKVMT